VCRRGSRRARARLTCGLARRDPGGVRPPPHSPSPGRPPRDAGEITRCPAAAARATSSGVRPPRPGRPRRLHPARGRRPGPPATTPMSCSAGTTVLPESTRRCSCRISSSTSAACSPVVGSRGSSAASGRSGSGRRARGGRTPPATRLDAFAAVALLDVELGVLVRPVTVAPRTATRAEAPWHQIRRHLRGERRLAGARHARHGGEHTELVDRLANAGRGRRSAARRYGRRQAGDVLAAEDAPLESSGAGPRRTCAADVDEGIVGGHLIERSRQGCGSMIGGDRRGAVPGEVGPVGERPSPPVGGGWSPCAGARP
jgi:hypothetical protein